MATRYPFQQMGTGFPLIWQRASDKGVAYILSAAVPFQQRALVHAVPSRRPVDPSAESERAPSPALSLKPSPGTASAASGSPLRCGSVLPPDDGSPPVISQLFLLPQLCDHHFSRNASVECLLAKEGTEVLHNSTHTRISSLDGPQQKRFR